MQWTAPKLERQHKQRSMRQVRKHVAIMRKATTRPKNTHKQSNLSARTISGHTFTSDSSSQRERLCPTGQVTHWTEPSRGCRSSNSNICNTMHSSTTSGTHGSKCGDRTTADWPNTLVFIRQSVDWISDFCSSALNKIGHAAT